MSNMTRSRKGSVINLSYLVFLVVWQPIKLLTIQIDGKGRIPFVFTLLVLFYNLSANPEVKKLMGGKPFAIWLIWIGYAFVNMMVKGYHYPSNTPFFYLVNGLIAPYLALALTCSECLINRGRVLKFLIVALIVYCVLGFFFMDTVRSESDSSLTLGNLLAINGSLLVYLLITARNDGIVSRFSFAAIVILIMLMIISTATRKAFGVALILLAFYGLSLVSSKPKYIIVVFLLMIGAYIGMEYIMNNTYLGERLVYIGDQAAKYDFNSESRYLQFVGDRAPHYVYGWDLFKQHPVTGVGLHNFMYVSGFFERLHTDYMVQFAENGIVGVILYVLFLFWFIRHLYKLWQVDGNKSYAIIGLGWIAAVLFLGITTWTFESVTVYICYGVTASFVLST